MRQDFDSSLTRRGGPVGSPILMKAHSCLEMAEPEWKKLLVTERPFQRLLTRTQQARAVLMKHILLWSG